MGQVKVIQGLGLYRQVPPGRYLLEGRIGRDARVSFCLVLKYEPSRRVQCLCGEWMTDDSFQAHWNRELKVHEGLVLIMTEGMKDRSFGDDDYYLPAKQVCLP